MSDDSMPRSTGAKTQHRSIDVSRQIGAVDRSLSFSECEGVPTNVLTLTQDFGSDISEIWTALTAPESISSWFLPVTGELRAGGSYQFEGNAGGTILECTPPHQGKASFVATWEFGGGITWVRIRLRSLGTVESGGPVTECELTHTAKSAEVPTEMWETYGPGATGIGWDGGFLGLALHLGEVDGALSPTEAPEWATSDEGRAFYRGSAKSWGIAHVKAGGSSEAASAAARASYEFYTGDTQSE